MRASKPTSLTHSHKIPISDASRCRLSNHLLSASADAALIEIKFTRMAPWSRLRFHQWLTNVSRAESTALPASSFAKKTTSDSRRLAMVSTTRSSDPSKAALLLRAELAGRQRRQSRSWFFSIFSFARTAVAALMRPPAAAAAALLRQAIGS
jgi:hypothetical protein